MRCERGRPRPPAAPDGLGSRALGLVVALLARVPLRCCMGWRLLGWLSLRVYAYRSTCCARTSPGLPALRESQLRAVIRAYYRGFAQMLVEIFKAVVL